MGILIVCADVLPCFVSCYILNTDFLVAVFTSYVEEVFVTFQFHFMGRKERGKTQILKEMLYYKLQD